MSVGLYDVDFFEYHQVLLNLEIMKLATYFKGKKEITALSPTYSPERYGSFYLRKDFYDGTFPNKLTQYPNLKYGGLAFTDNKYRSLPEDIESCAPDLFLYDRYKELFTQDKKSYQAVYGTLTRNSHLRLSLDGKTVWPDFEKQISSMAKSRVVFFHDPAIHEIEDAEETIRYILEKYSKKKNEYAILATKFPIHCAGLEEFMLWNKFTFSDVFCAVQIDNLLTDEEFIELINSISSNKGEKIYYEIGNALSSSNDFLEETLLKIYQQIIFCCMHRKQIVLTINDKFSVSEKTRDLILLFNLYIRAAAVCKDGLPSLQKFCKNLRPREYRHMCNVIVKEDARETFFFVSESYPELFKLFYECNKVELKGGVLICQH